MRKPTTPATDIRRVAAYTRVSSLRQANEGDSIEAQRNMIAAYGRSRLNIDPATISYYVDAGKSAKDQNRPELQRLKRDILEGRIGRVIVFKLDRITRSLLDFAELWEMFRHHQVEITSLQEDFDTSGHMGQAMLQIIMVFAELERKLIGERTRAVMMDRIERGLCNGSIRWGYKHDPAQNGRLVPDPEWAPIVREHFFNACERLGSAGAVQRHLRELGIMVPKRQSPDGKTRGGKPFSKQQVIGVLMNEVYLGTLVWGGLRKEDCHEPLVTKEQFERVQRILSRNRNSSVPRAPTGQYPFLLKGILRCRCGYMMTSCFSTGRSGQLHYYYTCTDRTHRGRGTCDAPYVPAAAIDEAVVQRVMELAGDQIAQDKVVRMAIGMADEDARRVRADADQVRRRIGEIQTEINNLVAALKTMGAGAVASVQEALTACETEREQLRQKLDALTMQEASLGQVTGDAAKFLEAWRRVRDLFAAAEPATKREIVQHFVESLDWLPADPKGRTGTYCLTFFPEVLDGRDYTGDNRPNEGGGGNGLPEKKNAPVLSPVRESVQKAPRS